MQQGQPLKEQVFFPCRQHLTSAERNSYFQNKACSSYNLLYNSRAPGLQTPVIKAPAACATEAAPGAAGRRPYKQHCGPTCSWSSIWGASLPGQQLVGGLALRIRDNLKQQASLSAGTFLHGCYRVQHGQQLEQLRPESAGSIWRGAGCIACGTAPNLSAGVASNIWPASCNLAGSFLPSTTLGHMNSKRTPQPADMRRCLTWGSCQTSLAGGTVCTQGSMSASWLHWVQKAASQWLQSRWVEAQSRASWTPACPLYLSSGVL